MSVFIFKKETKGFSISKDGKKSSYGGDISFRAFPKGSEATIRITPDFGAPLSGNLTVHVSKDTITVNEVLFAGTATALIDSLRDTVFYN